MYRNWNEVEQKLTARSVLQRFSSATGLVVTNAVVEELVHQSVTHAAAILTDTELKWCLEVINYALSLSLNSNYAIISKGVHLCCDWLTCVCKTHQPGLPNPLKDRPIFYGTEILTYLYRLFSFQWIHGSNSPESAIRRVRECERTLIQIRHIVPLLRDDLQAEMFPEILKFLLNVCQSLLAFPFEIEEEIGALCTLAMQVLFFAWIHCCKDNFPSPCYWKSFSNLCIRYRFRVPVVETWARFCAVLSSRVINQLYGSNYCKMRFDSNDTAMVPSCELSASILSQTWYRMLTLFGNLGLFFDSSQISENSQLTSGHSEASLTDSLSTDSSETCTFAVAQPAYCFFLVMATMEFIVSGFMGVEINCCLLNQQSSAAKEFSNNTAQQLQSTTTTTTATVHTQSTISQSSSFLKAAIRSASRGKEAKAARSLPLPTSNEYSRPSSGLSVSHQFLKEIQTKPLFNIEVPANRPTVDSLLDLVGAWLFEAAVLRTEGVTVSEEYDFRAGKAVALSVLCKIICLKRSLEKISSDHLACFYSVIRKVLEEKDPLLVSSLLVHSVNVFRLNLPGFERLCIQLIAAVHWLITEESQALTLPVTQDCLLLSCLCLLSSVVTFPFHITSITSTTTTTTSKTKVQEKPAETSCNDDESKLWKVMLTLLDKETDTKNLQLTIYVMTVHCFSTVMWSKGDSKSTSKLRTALISLSELLTAKKSSDYIACLAIFDSLSTLLNLPDDCFASDIQAFEKVLFTVCRVIESQLALPSRVHSRDLHSTIVAAFSFLENLLIRFPTLLNTEACLQAVCHMVELGLYGCVVEVENLDNIQKRPASQRVHDAADQLLHSMFTRVGESFETVSRFEDENFLLENITDHLVEKNENFLYVLYNSCIFCVTEPHYLTDHTNETALVLRTPSVMASCHRFCLETLPDHNTKSVPRPTGVKLESLRRPMSMFNLSMLENVPNCKVDFSIPELTMNETRNRILSAVKNFENQFRNEYSEKIDDSNCASIDDCFQNFGKGEHHARVLLYDLGVIQFDNDQPEFQVLDSELENFFSELKSLDRIPSRYITTAHIFYVKQGQTKVAEILRNAETIDASRSNPFFSFLSDLGYALPVRKHCIWTGNWESAYLHKAAKPPAEVVDNPSGVLIDGLSHVIYWSSPLVEIAFLVPWCRRIKITTAKLETTTCVADGQSCLPVRPPRSKSLLTSNVEEEANLSVHQRHSHPPPHKQQHLRNIKRASLKTESSQSVQRQRRCTPAYQDHKVLILWLSCIEDVSNIPVDDLLEYTDTGENVSSAVRFNNTVYRIYITELTNRLYSLKISFPFSKLGNPGPVVDGLVVGQSMLGPLVRQTVLSISQRRRLEQEGLASAINYSLSSCFEYLPFKNIALAVMMCDTDDCEAPTRPIPTNIINELCCRFLFNMPEEERTDPVRACFHIELAHWFYCDHFSASAGYPTCSLKEFIRAVFSNSADLQQYTSNLDDVLAQWRQYKSGVPVYGAILVNAQLDSVLLVQGFFARRSWGFPKGKINEGETVQQCAVREVLEETGYDIGKLMTDSPYLERKFGGYTCGLFLVTGVEHDFPFQPQTKNEIGRLQWFLIDALPKHSKDYKSSGGYQPKHFFTVTPFLHFIKMHIRNERSRLEALRTSSLVVLQGSLSTTTDEEQLSSKGIETFLFGSEDDPIISSSFRQVEEEVTNYERIRRGLKKDQPKEVQIGSTRDLFGPLIGTPPSEKEILQDIRMTTGLTPMATSSPISTTCSISADVHTSRAHVFDRWMRHRQPVAMPSDADDESSTESSHSEVQSTSVERAVEISGDQLDVISAQSRTREQVPVKQSTARKRLLFDSFPTNESTSSMGSCQIDKEPCTSKQMMERDRMRRGNVTQESDLYLLDLNVVIMSETSADERAILQAEVDMLNPSNFVVTSVQAVPTNVTTTTTTTTASSAFDIDSSFGSSSAVVQSQYRNLLANFDSDQKSRVGSSRREFSANSTFSSGSQFNSSSAGETSDTQDFGQLISSKLSEVSVSTSSLSSCSSSSNEIIRPPPPNIPRILPSRTDVVYPITSACTNPECRHATLASMQQRVSERLGMNKPNQANMSRLVPSAVVNARLSNSLMHCSGGADRQASGSFSPAALTVATENTTTPASTVSSASPSEKLQALSERLPPSTTMELRLDMCNVQSDGYCNVYHVDGPCPYNQLHALQGPSLIQDSFTRLYPFPSVQQQNLQTLVPVRQQSVKSLISIQQQRVESPFQPIYYPLTMQYQQAPVQQQNFHSFSMYCQYLQSSAPIHYHHHYHVHSSVPFNYHFQNRQPSMAVHHSIIQQQQHQQQQQQEQQQQQLHFSSVSPQSEEQRSEIAQHNYFLDSLQRRLSDRMNSSSSSMLLYPSQLIRKPS
ncbi:m7GpppN-mRNA hydrolase [Trichinella papuae]|uniref:mRNA-decapping enzyme 2 n=1 Tax=Trichinella papuae TaxID=268474 RepID=A0A0V1M440_9BILA|nr:m7GpppN-mRNA hydrolase [Trichinella papuae]